MSLKRHLGELVNVCDACLIPLQHIEKPILVDFKDKVYSFCSSACAEEFYADPIAYTTVETEEDVE